MLPYSKLCILLIFLVQPPSSVARRSSYSEMSLTTRLKADDTEESSRCWESLFQLQSCTGEVITFFMTGETYLGPGCCHAIRTIQSQCWPNMLASLGYTDEEGDVLEGYCNAASQSPPILEPNDVLGIAPP